MDDGYSIFVQNNMKYLSWSFLLSNLYRIQNRLFKSVYVLDMSKAFAFQKLIFISRVSHLLAVRQVTQLDSNRKLPGVDGHVCLTFRDRFELCHYLKINLYSWNPSLAKSSIIVKKNGDLISLNLSTIKDRSWHSLIKFSLEPAHEATFSSRSFGSRLCISVHYVQKLFFYNLNSTSFGIQKRIMLIDLTPVFSNFDSTLLIKKLIVTRAIKLGIFRCLNLGFLLGFTKDSLEFPNLASLLSNVLLNGVESLHSSLRYSNQILFFLKPFDNEVTLFKRLSSFLYALGFPLSLSNYLLASSLNGFDFLGWKFRVSPKGTFFSFPSYESYQQFLLRVKHILNNSNYGSVCSSFIVSLWISLLILFKRFILFLNLYIVFFKRIIYY
jgi:retron-type reverse transcriptase